MIAEFTVENFRSFKEKNTFSLISTKDKELSDLNTFETKKNLRFLRTAVIYGANASGKSNFFKALVFFLNFSVFSGPRKQVEDPIETEPFALSIQTKTAPSKFEIIFIINENGDEIRYRYGLIVNNKQVLSEYLYAIKNVREVMLFLRNSQKIEYTSYFKEGGRAKAAVRNNCSFLSVCAQNNGEISAQVVKYFRSMGVLYGVYDTTFRLDKNINNPEQKKKIIDFLRFADIQITGYRTEKVPAFKDMPDPELAAILNKNFPNVNEERILFGHAIFDEDKPIGEIYLDASDESSGTNKLFSYSSYILSVLDKGSTLFIDEFDTMLHPLIIENIIKLFNSPITNPKNSQLIISCHAINIMTNKLLHRDQIWFCEKDKYGATDLYSLVEYKDEEKRAVRKDSSYNKNYLQGKYGAIPYIDNILSQSGFEK